MSSPHTLIVFTKFKGTNFYKEIDYSSKNNKCTVSNKSAWVKLSERGITTAAPTAPTLVVFRKYVYIGEEIFEWRE
jgi:hypothetical protein